jgi:hypothetical protein
MKRSRWYSERRTCESVLQEWLEDTSVENVITAFRTISSDVAECPDSLGEWQRDEDDGYGQVRLYLFLNVFIGAAQQ